MGGAPAPFCSRCGGTGGTVLTDPARPEPLPERKPFPLEWVFPAMLVGSLGALIGCILPGQPWQPGALIGFMLVALPRKKLS